MRPGRPFPIFTFLLVVTLTAIGLLTSLPFAAGALVFFWIFDFGDPWHLFVFIHSTTIPLLAVVGYVLFTFYRTWTTAALSALLSLAAFGTHLLWSNPLSNGLLD